MKSILFKLVIIVTLSSSEILNSITGFVQGMSQESPATNDTRETVSTSFPSSAISSSSSSSPSSSSSSSATSSINPSSLSLSNTISGSSLAAVSPLSDVSSESSAVNAAYLTSKDASDSKQDQLPQASSPSVHHHSQHHSNHYSNHQNHQNHQNYPIEPYLGASYTSLTISTPSPSFNQSSNAYATNNQPQFSSFTNEGNTISNTFSNSYGNQAAQLDSRGNNYQASSTNHGNHNLENHNYGTQSKGVTNIGSLSSSPSSSLNTGLIQNLTASLFPIKQLSNATLYTLSELLNKTRQSTSPGTYSHFTNGYKPTFNLAYPAYFTTQNSGQTTSSSSSSSPSTNTNTNTNPHHSHPLASSTNYHGLESSTLGNIEQQYNLFDYIRPSQFGFRQANNPQATRYHHPASSAASLFRHANSGTKTSPGSSINQNQYNNYGGPTSLPTSDHYFTTATTTATADNQNQLNSGYKTSSNIYNTYIPFKDNSISSLPTMTNGQSLNMALYGYKLPLLINNKPFSSSAASTSNNQNISPGYQFIQHHNMNNQDHLDKIVYHSTPFRPSIVSPPILTTISNSPNTTPSSILTLSTPSPLSSIQSGQSLSSSSSSSSPSSSSSSSSSSLNNQRSKSESLDNNKSLAFGSLSSSSSAISDSKSDYTTNGQANNASKYSSFKDSSNSRVGGPDILGQYSSSSSNNNNKGTNDKTSFQTTTSTMSPLNSDNDSGGVSSTYDGSRNNSMVEKVNHGPVGHGINPGQEMLFDLYEREIDNQIRDALYNEAPAHVAAESLIPGHTRTPQIAADWFEKTAQSLYEDPSSIEQTLNSWERPVALSPHNAAAYLPTSTANSAATRIRAQPLPVHSDPLADALQELPTFSATDLQPIFPTGPAYSLIPTPSHDSTQFSETQPASSLASSFFPLFHTNQNHNHHQHHQQNPITLESELSNKYTSFNRPLSSHSSPSTSSSSSSQQPLGLQSILFKLHSSPLSSILSSPLTHLYSSLPKPYKYNKRPTSSSQSVKNQNSQQSIFNAYNHITSPTSLFPLHSLGGITGKQLLNALSNGNSIFDTIASASSGSHKVTESPKNTHLLQQQQQQLKQQHQQQQQQAAIAAATANFLAAANAAAEHQSSMNRYQAALLANNIYLNHQTAPPETSTDLSMIGRTALPGRIVTHASFAEPAATSSPATGALGSGLSGGGISPLIWRSIFSPANWARKQSTTSSGQSSTVNNNNNHNFNQHQPLLQATSLSPSIKSLTLTPQISALQGSQKSSIQQTSNGGGSGSSIGNINGGGALNLAISYNKQQLPQLNTLFGNQIGPKSMNQKRPRIKIKILKIPVAYYDQAPTSGGSLSSGSVSSPSISLAPSQMQPAVTASLLSTLPCPLHHNTLQPAHSLEQHIANQSASSSSSSSIGHNSTSSSSYFPASASSISPTYIHSSSSSSSLDSNQPISIQGFTDINQPNDLQVSPSNLQGKLFKIIQQAAVGNGAIGEVVAA